VIALEVESSLRVEHADVLEIECVRGVLWITREGDLCDRFIGSGESFNPSGRGVTLATALERTLVRVVERRRASWLGWFARRPVVRTLRSHSLSAV
jgi:Protein of unknown function (DUF2917)